MRTSRPGGIAALVLVAGLALTGCQSAAEGDDAGAGEEPAVVAPAEDGGPSRLTLSAPAVERLGLETRAVATASDGLVIPYGGVVYDNEGQSWAFVEVDERTYERVPISIADIVGDQAFLDAGPAVGTEVVTVGAAELVGVEAGISGGE